MIVAYITFKPAKKLSREEAKKIFTGTSERYRTIPGLVRKYYLFDDANATVGGAYLWETLEAAQKTYNEDWQKFIFNTYQATPEIRYFECPIVVDNPTNSVFIE